MEPGVALRKALENLHQDLDYHILLQQTVEGVRLILDASLVLVQMAREDGSPGPAVAAAGDKGAQQGPAPLALPLVCNGQAIGVISAWVREPEAFPPSALTAAETFAGVAAAALQQAHSLEESQKLIKELVANARTYERLIREGDLDGLTGLYSHRHLQEHLSLAVEKAGSQGKAVSLILCDLDNFRIVNDNFGYQAGDQILRECAGVLRSLFSDDVIIARYTGNQFAILMPGVGPAAALQAAQRLGSRLSAHRFPNPAKPGAGAAVCLTASVGVASFPEDAHNDAELVQAADFALLEAQRQGGDRVQGFRQATALARESRWYNLLRVKLPRRTSDAYVSTVRTLLAALDAKDSYTGSHATAVAHWSEQIARRMGLTEDMVATVTLGGLLHDIGKIGIPDVILAKDGALTTVEYQQIQEHPALGLAILKNVAVPADIVEIIYLHHERFDGKGYPTGMMGEEIPLGARIVTAADAFHSMTSHRSYRKAMPLREAMAELRRCAGGMFDASVVKSFLEVLADHDSWQAEETAT